jgi:hypothetical protein
MSQLTGLSWTISLPLYLGALRSRYVYNTKRVINGAEVGCIYCAKSQIEAKLLSPASSRKLKKVRVASDPGLFSLLSNVGFGREFQYERERRRFCALTDREA